MSDGFCPEHGTAWLDGMPCNRCMRAHISDDDLRQIEQMRAAGIVSTSMLCPRTTKTIQTRAACRACQADQPRATDAESA